METGATTRMRVCFVLLPIEHYSPVSGGAIATITFHLAQELERQGHEVYVLAAADGQPQYPSGTVLSVFGAARTRGEKLRDWLESRFLRWEWHGYGRFRQEVQRWLVALQPAVVVFANDLLAPEWGRDVLPGARVGVWLHNQCRPRRSVGVALKKTDFFITCSGYLRDWYLKEFRLDPHRVRAVLAGVDHSMFWPGDQAADSGGLRVLFVGRLDYNKGLDLAVEAVRALHRAGRDIQLTVAGSVWFHSGGIFSLDYMEHLRPALQGGAVDWLGHVPRRWLPEVMRRQDVCLVLSRSEEPFGLVVLEAMASGLAVVTSGRGGLPEAGAGAAMVMENLSEAAVRSTLEEFYENRTLLRHWKQRSLQRAESAGWGKTAADFQRAVAGGCFAREYETVGS
jgi:glycosyltransferase involved in cell wall biosynthesis